MFRISLIMIATMAIAGSALAGGYRSSSASGAVAYIISPKDGETVQNPVKVVFGLSGMGVCPAGLEKNNTGHHHLLIDTGFHRSEIQSLRTKTTAILVVARQKR